MKDAKVGQSRMHAVFDVVANAADLFDGGAYGIADSPIPVANALGDLDLSDAVPHRHDHVGTAQYVVGTGRANCSSGSRPSSAIAVRTCGSISSRVVVPAE